MVDMPLKQRHMLIPKNRVLLCSKKEYIHGLEKFFFKNDSLH